MPKFRDWAGAVLLTALLTSPALAQNIFATLAGTITDQTGAVLPGVTVTVQNTETNLTRTVATDGREAFVVAQLPVGTYAISAELQGFRTEKRTGIVL